MFYPSAPSTLVLPDESGPHLTRFQYVACTLYTCSAVMLLTSTRLCVSRKLATLHTTKTSIMCTLQQHVPKYNANESNKDTLRLEGSIWPLYLPIRLRLLDFQCTRPYSAFAHTAIYTQVLSTHRKIKACSLILSE